MRPLWAFVALLASCSSKQIAMATGDADQLLRKRPPGAPQSSPGAPPVLIVELDGMDRDLLYAMLRAGELPYLEDLLGGDHLAHAYFDDQLLSTLPSTTMAAWVSAMTGVTPAEHGVTGNELFIRERREFACPAPVSFRDSDATLSIYTDHSIDRLADAPTIYELMRRREPAIQIWVATDHLFRGADRLLVLPRTAIVKAFAGFVERAIAVATGSSASPELYLRLDRTTVDAVVEHLAHDPPPDVLTLYVAGTDLYTHVAPEGPDRARREYMKRLDGQFGRVAQALRKRGQLDREWVVVLADHGHTPVLRDHVHALGGPDGAPPAILHAAGFRVRPFRREVSAGDPFSAVLAYGGPMAYVYVADRSRCPGPNDVCDWAMPPRYDEDVLPAADAFFRANRDGAGDPRMKGTLDLVLVRRPRPVAEVDLPFEVYIGDGKAVSIAEYLVSHPHPTYVEFEPRMHDLAVGVHGERAGDIVLLTHDGDVDQIEDRFYFAFPYHSWHGSPSRRDSEIPLIVANRHHTAAEIGPWVRARLGPHPYLERITDLLLGLRNRPLGD
jgi:hypothetical protein